jgi:hypothetical protein
VAYPGEPQRDLVAEAPTTCPTCGGPWRAAVKVCRKCGKPVARSERWRMVPAGPGLFAIEHREPCGVVGDGGRMQQLLQLLADLAPLLEGCDCIHSDPDNPVQCPCKMLRAMIEVPSHGCG